MPPKLPWEMLSAVTLPLLSAVPRTTTESPLARSDTLPVLLTVTLVPLPAVTLTVLPLAVVIVTVLPLTEVTVPIVALPGRPPRRVVHPLRRREGRTHRRGIVRRLG